MKKVQICRLCGGEMELGCALEDAPFGDVFEPTKEAAMAVPLAPYELMHCKACHNMQTSIDPSSEIYKNYIYVSSSSVDLPAHYAGVAGQLAAELKGVEHAFVVEFGSNEGMLLGLVNLALTRDDFGGGGNEPCENSSPQNQPQALKTPPQAHKMLGIDPSPLAAQMANKRGIETINDYFSETLARQIATQRGKADLIIANFVMANISNMDDIGCGVSTLLADNGVFVFETGYGVQVVERALIDTIYPEHISYFSLTALVPYLARFGLRVFRAEVTRAKGGALRVWATPAASARASEPSVAEILAREKSFFLTPGERFSTLQKRVEILRQKVQAKAREIKAQGELLVYGASIGGVAMVEQYGLGEMVDYFIDDNALKIGRYSPSRGILVQPSSYLVESGASAVLSCAWRFMEQITAKNAEFLARGGVFYAIDLEKLELVGYGR